MTRKSKRKRAIKAIAGELGIGHRGTANVLDKREAEKPPCHSWPIIVQADPGPIEREVSMAKVKVEL